MGWAAWPKEYRGGKPDKPKANELRADEPKGPKANGFDKPNN